MPEETNSQQEMFNQNPNNPNPGEETPGEKTPGEETPEAENKFEERMSAMEQSNTELQGKIAEQNETIQAQQEVLDVRSQQQQSQQQQQGGGYSEEEKMKYEKEFGMDWDEIVKTQSFVSRSMQGMMKPILDREVARDLRETQREIRSVDTRFKHVEADVNKRFNLLPPEQKNSEVYINLVRQVKEENFESIIESEVKQKMEANKGVPPAGGPVIGGGGTVAPQIFNPVSENQLDEEQASLCNRYGVSVEDAQKSVDEDIKITQDIRRGR